MSLFAVSPAPASTRSPPPQYPALLSSIEVLTIVNEPAETAMPPPPSTALLPVKVQLEIEPVPAEINTAHRRSRSPHSR